MKLLICLILFPLTALGNTHLKQFFKSSYADQVCQKTLRVQGNYTYRNLSFVAGNENHTFFVSNKNNNFEVKVISLRSGVENIINLEKQVVDVKINQGEIFVLTQNHLYIYDEDLKLVESSRTLPKQINYKKYGYATGMAIKDHIVYISHGDYGFSQYDRKVLKIKELINPAVPQPLSSHRSSLAGIAVMDNYLYLSYDDITLHQKTKAFEGVVIWNLQSQDIHRVIPVNQRREAYYKPSLTVDRDELIIANLHLNFRHKLKSLETDRYMNPLLRLWKYPAGKIIGKGFVLNGEIYGCFHDEYNNVISANFSSIQ